MFSNFKDETESRNATDRSYKNENVFESHSEKEHGKENDVADIVIVDDDSHEN